jgi:hypothetical protein
MPAEDRFTLGELKKIIKEHMKTTPKLSSGKQNLLLYADKAGLLKKKEAAPAPAKAELPSALKKPVKEVKIAKELPETLKKAKEVEPVKAKKAPTGFAAFMSANKGKGLSMSQMSQMYRESKE